MNLSASFQKKNAILIYFLMISTVTWGQRQFFVFTRLLNDCLLYLIIILEECVLILSQKLNTDCLFHCLFILIFELQS